MRDEDDLPDFDYADPLKRDPDDPDDDPGGLDPAITVPPEDRLVTDRHELPGSGVMVSPMC